VKGREDVQFGHKVQISGGRSFNIDEINRGRESEGQRVV
jgi:hypothetical protein